MGREIKRVALDFDWPLHEVWKGFVNPFYKYCQRCFLCGGSGYNPQTKKLSDTWYWRIDSEDHWDDKITQDEVDVLVAKGRLMDFTHTWTKGVGWRPKDPPYRPTAEEVNKCSQAHDSINQWICVEKRTKRLGVWGLCKVCQGEGEIWDSPGYKKLYDEWEPEEPPAGEGWQLWETVSEGSPISPVLATKEEFVAYLVGQGHSREAAKRFIEDGWAPSMVIVNSGDTATLLNDIDSAILPRVGE